MNQSNTLLWMAALMMLLTASQAVICEERTEKPLICSENKDNIEYDDVTHYCTAELEPFSILLKGNQEECAVDLVVSADVEIREARMKLTCGEEEMSPTDVSITMDDKLIAECQGDFTRLECTKQLRDSMTAYLGQKKGDWPIRVPLVFKCQNGGRIEFESFSVKFRLSPPTELEPLSYCENGMPKYFVWRPVAGLSPRYELQIRSENFSSDSEENLFRKPEIVSAFYKLDENDINTLDDKLEPGKAYNCGVRVIYDFGNSRWAKKGFVTKPDSVENLEKIGEPDELKFLWEHGNAEYYEIWLNGHLLEEQWEKRIYTIEDPHYLIFVCSCEGLSCAKNRLTVLAVIDGVKSEPTVFDFPYRMDQLQPPEGLVPNLDKLVEEEKFPFYWNNVEGAGSYEVELRDSDNHPLGFPEKYTVIISDRTTYNPWEAGDMTLAPGRLYKWKVRALPPPGSNIRPSEWTEMFFYQPVALWLLTLCAGFGGLLGGFIRIASEERIRAKERTIKIYRDYKIYLEFLVGVIIGVVFYLIINQTVNPDFNVLNVTPFSYPGSLILGFIGGLVSYDIIKLIGKIQR